MAGWQESDIPFLTRHSRQGQGKGALGEEKPGKNEISTPGGQKRQSVGTRHGKKPGPNKTEAEYGRMLALEYPGAKIRYEGITLRLDNGHAYTPDWFVALPTGEVIMVEVKARGKNGFRHPSYQRARCMFDQCKVDYPMWKWRWAEKRWGGWDWDND